MLFDANFLQNLDKKELSEIYLKNYYCLYQSNIERNYLHAKKFMIISK